MKNKKIRYVSLEPSAFLLDLDYISMTYEERGLYDTIIFYLYGNDGYLPMEKLFSGAFNNCTNFEKIFKKIKRKFLIKNGKISHKRVLRELKRARQISQVNSANGVRGNEIRWKNHHKTIAQQSQSDSEAITTRSEGKGSEDKRREGKRSEEGEAQKEEEKKRVMASHFVSPSDSSNGSSQRLVSQLASQLASQSVSLNGSSQRLASQPAGIISRDLTLTMFNFHDELCRIFPQRTPADSSSIRNLANWVRDCIRLGLFQEKIIGNVLAIARDSKKGKSRKPIAVFYARLKKELNYGSDLPAAGRERV